MYMPQPPQNFTRDNQQPYHQIQQNQPQQQMGGGYGPGPPMPPTNIPSMMNPQMGQPPFRGGEGLIPQQFPSTTADQQPPPVINGFVQQHPLGGMGARGGQQDINGLSSQFSQMQPPSGAFQPIPATNAPTMQMPPSPFPSATRPPSHGQQIGQQSTPQPPEFINHPQPQLGRPPAGFPPVSSSLNTASIPPMLPPPATGPTSQFGQQQPQQMGDWLPPTQQPGMGPPGFGTPAHFMPGGAQMPQPQMPAGQFPQMPGPPMSLGFPSQVPGTVPQMPGAQMPAVPQMPGSFMPPPPGQFPSGPGQFDGMPSMQGHGGMMPPQYPQQQQRAKLDPDAMPSIVQVCDDDRNIKSGVFRTGFPTAEFPPLSSTEFIAQDQGNVNPKFMRSTIYAVPQQNEMLKSSQLPLSFAISPIARLHPNEYAPHIIDLGENGPVRCQRCKAYMCPFMEFVDGGRKFKCPFCKAVSTVADTYFAHLDHNGRRTDFMNRPELYCGSYEFVATRQYCKNGVAPKEPAFIFMLDVSYNSVRSGLLELFCKNIVEILRSLPRDITSDKSHIKIGLATFDQTIHFYNMSQHCYSQMLIVNDINDIFVPFIDGFLVDFSQAEQTIASCLNEIINNFSNTRITETILGPVIQAGIDALKCSDRTGKIFIFSTSMPTLEAPGQLKNREDRKILGTDKEKTVLSPANEFYVKLGEQCVQTGCSVDLFLFPNSYVDIASIAPVANISGGSLYKYQYFDIERDGQRFLSDLKHNVSRDIIFDVMMRLRTSTGLRPTGYFGNFFMQNTTDVELGSIDCDKAFQIEIKYDDKLDEKELAYFQIAILFTSCNGQRRLRVHNLALQITSDYSIIYRLIDEDSLVTHLFKQAEQLSREKSPKEMKDEITQRAAHILATYREKCSQQTPIGQMILPECSKLLPLHSCCITKCDALTGGSELTVDDRSWMMSLVPSLTVHEATQFLYPRVYVVSNLTLEPDGSILIPRQIRASAEYFSSEEAYLMENNMVAFIWVGLNVPAEWIQTVFGVSSIVNLDTEKHELPSRDTPQSRALCQFYELINEDRPRHLKLYIIKEQDGLESWMKKFLAEDRYGNNSVSYVDYLCKLHNEIRNMLS